MGFFTRDLEAKITALEGLLTAALVIVEDTHKKTVDVNQRITAVEQAVGILGRGAVDIGEDVKVHISKTADGTFEPLQDAIAEGADEVKEHAEKSDKDLRTFITDELKKVTDAQEKLRHDVNVALKDTVKAPRGLGDIINQYIESVK